MKKLLMHTCCAPCFVYIQQDIYNNSIINEFGKLEEVDLTALWYNPNIHPKVEYERRKNTFIEFCNKVNCNYELIDEYGLTEFTTEVINNVGEGKKYNLRCEYCYYTRLNKVFEYAKANNYDMVSTTLSISPYQNQELLKEIGKNLEKKYNIKFWYKDYTPYFREGQKMARDMELYRQKYCGCIFSIDSRKVGVLMGKYSKNKLKLKRFIPLLAIILVVILIISITLLIYISVKNNIVIENIDEQAKYVSDDVALKSNPIIVNNILLGAVYEKTWVSSDKFYQKNPSVDGREIDMYTKNGKAGKFKLNNFNKKANESTIYTSTNSLNKIDEYFAVQVSEGSVMPNIAKAVTPTSVDIKSVKKALGMYKLLNNTVNITETYDIRLSTSENGRLICATSGSKNMFGVYSIVVYDNGKNVICLKYNYIKNTNNASQWPTYSLKFVADLNSDGIGELILQETKEFSAKYDILEYKNNKFSQVLDAEVKL